MVTVYSGNLLQFYDLNFCFYKSALTFSFILVTVNLCFGDVWSVIYYFVA